MYKQAETKVTEMPAETLLTTPDVRNQPTPVQAAIDNSIHKIRNPLEHAAADSQGNIVGAHDVASERYAIAANEALGDGVADEDSVWTAQKVREELLRNPEMSERLDALAERSPALRELDEGMAHEAEADPRITKAGKLDVKREEELEAENENSPYPMIGKLQEMARSEEAKVADSLKEGSMYVCKITPVLESLRGLYLEDGALAERIKGFVEQIDTAARQKQAAGEKDPELALSHAVRDTYRILLSNAERQVFSQASENEQQRQFKLSAESSDQLTGSFTPAPEYLFGSLYHAVR